MKSKFKKRKVEDEKPEDQESDHEDTDSEVDSSGPGVASAKGSKMVAIAASVVLTIVVVYFLFFKGEQAQKTEKLEEVKTATSSDVPGADVAPPPTDSFLEELPEEDVLLEKPDTPELPKLPELPKPDQEESSGILPVFLDLPAEKKPVGSQVQDQNALPVVSGTQALPEQQSPQGPQFQPMPGGPVATAGPDKEQQVVAPVVVDPRRSPIVVIKGGVGPTLGVGYENNIRKLKEDPIDSLKKTESKVIPTIVADRSTTITQGKMMTAVLETAINTEMPGNVRAIVTRDVYAESGTNVLIPKGSRLYGNYSAEVSRGQGRVQINWTRLIRPDGVDMSVTFNAADQFGRSGIEGDVDNKYGSIIGNSILTSILAVGGAIAAEKLSGNKGATTTTTDPQTGTTTSTGTASSKAIYDVSKTIIDTIGQVVGNAIDLRPVIRVPQGTRVTIIVNQDMTIPAMRK